MNLPDRIIELSEKATPGPWHGDEGDYSVEADGDPLGMNCVAVTDHCDSIDRLGESQCKANTALIAEYRTLAPRLAEWAKKAAAFFEERIAYEDSACEEFSVGCWNCVSRALLKELEVDDV